MSTDGTSRQVGTAWRCERERKTQGAVEDSLSKSEPIQMYKSNADVSNVKGTRLSDGANLERQHMTENATIAIQTHDGNGPASVASSRPWQAHMGVSPSVSEFVGARGAKLTTTAPVSLQQQEGSGPDVNICSVQGVDNRNTTVTPSPPVLRAWPVGLRKAQSVSAVGSKFAPVASTSQIQGDPRASSYDKELENARNVKATFASTVRLRTSVPQVGVVPLRREVFKNPEDVQPAVTKSTHVQRQESGSQSGQKLATLLSPKGWKAAQQYRSLSASVSAFRRFSMPQVHSTTDGGASGGANTADPPVNSSQQQGLRLDPQTHT